jgi:xylan 1,4-beta-xylosidase
MNHKLLIISISLFTLNLMAQNNKATFNYFEYVGNDSMFNQKIDNKNEFFNPILPGFYPDPSVCQKGEDYYLVNSTFSYFPGVPIFHSKDLVNWKQIGHILDRPSQLKTEGLELSEGIFAPAIEYNPENDTFYMITTLVKNGNSGPTFVVKAKNPTGPWSDPIWLPEVGGIDPSLSFLDGKAYVVNNENPEGGQSYKGHKAIWIQEFDIKTDKMIGTRKQIINGGNDITKKPIWIEGPHLYKIDKYYYLMAAEGGTGFNHSEVIFRSSDIFGPYIPNENNPILTQRNLPDDRENKVTCTGHADLIQNANGDWYAVFLGIRPYKDRFANTGRETFMLPVKWKDGFPVILEKGKPVPIITSIENTKVIGKTLSGNFSWRDDFNSPTLKMEWNMIRTPNEKWWSLSGNKLEIDAIERSINNLSNPAFIGRRQQHQIFTAETEIEFYPKTKKEIAGLVLFQNEKNYVFVGKTIIDDKPTLVIQNRIEGQTSLIVSHKLSDKDAKSALKLKFEVSGGVCKISYTSIENKSILLMDSIDITHLSTQKAKGFVGSYIGMYASSINE